MPRRAYRLGARAEGMRRTREAILDAAEALFGERWYDEVTLGDIARRAGVSQQTLLNHFGGKAALYLAGVAERSVPAIEAARSAAEPGDVASVVTAACEDYERSGVGTVRMLALADRVDELADLARAGRESHRAWVGAMFPAADARLVTLLAVVLDVRTWHQLRHEAGLDPAEVRAALEALVRGTLNRGAPGG